jgi:uncharacterized damage-inducible protein DinB
MRRCGIVLLVGLIAAPAASQSPQPAGQPLTAALRQQFEGVASNVSASAQAMPEDKYAYQPTKDVRTFGQLIGHIADVQYVFCSVAKGEPNPIKGSLEQLTSKSELVKAIAASNQYCSGVFASATDGWMLELIPGRQQPRAASLAFNTAHSNEHYGNIVTYMRINGLVPPSSAPR